MKHFWKAGGLNLIHWHGGQSLLNEHQFEFLESMAQPVLDNNIQGHVAEAGVYRGGSAKFLATMFADRDIYLFDSFDGMHEDDADTSGGHKTGDFADTSLEAVQELLKDHGNCKFYPGWFPNTAEFLTDEKFALVHLDMDYYQSTRAGIEVFWPRLVSGGVMVFDDFGWQACPGVERAANEYFEGRDDYMVYLPSTPIKVLALTKK